MSFSENNHVETLPLASDQTNEKAEEIEPAKIETSSSTIDQTNEKVEEVEPVKKEKDEKDEKDALLEEQLNKFWIDNVDEKHDIKFENDIKKIPVDLDKHPNFFDKSSEAENEPPIIKESSHTPPDDTTIDIHTGKIIHKKTSREAQIAACLEEDSYESYEEEEVVFVEKADPEYENIPAQEYYQRKMIPEEEPEDNHTFNQMPLQETITSSNIFNQQSLHEQHQMQQYSNNQNQQQEHPQYHESQNQYQQGQQYYEQPQDQYQQQNYQQPQNQYIQEQQYYEQPQNQYQQGQEPYQQPHNHQQEQQYNEQLQNQYQQRQEPYSHGQGQQKFQEDDESWMINPSQNYVPPMVNVDTNRPKNQPPPPNFFDKPVDNAIYSRQSNNFSPDVQPNQKLIPSVNKYAPTPSSKLLPKQLPKIHKNPPQNPTFWPERVNLPVHGRERQHTFDPSPFFNSKTRYDANDIPPLHQHLSKKISDESGYDLITDDDEETSQIYSIEKRLEYIEKLIQNLGKNNFRPKDRKIHTGKSCSCLSNKFQESSFGEVCHCDSQARICQHINNIYWPAGPRQHFSNMHSDYCYPNWNMYQRWAPQNPYFGGNNCCPYMANSSFY